MIKRLSLLYIFAPTLVVGSEEFSSYESRQEYHHFNTSFVDGLSSDRSQNYSRNITYDYNQTDSDQQVVGLTRPLIVSLQDIFKQQNYPNLQVYSLIIVNIYENPEFLTPVQRLLIYYHYPNLRTLSLVNFMLSFEEIAKFAMLFRNLESPIKIRNSISNARHNFNLRSAWDNLVNALNSPESTQEELELLMDTVNNLYKADKRALREKKYRESVLKLNKEFIRLRHQLRRHR